jgi:hypothetical protein
VGRYLLRLKARVNPYGPFFRKKAGCCAKALRHPCISPGAPLLPAYTDLLRHTGTLSINFRVLSYGGGAHESWRHRSISLDKSTGETTFERTRIRLSVKNMRNRSLTMDRIVFTPEGLKVVFAPYEQGGFAMGDVRAPIPLREVKRLGSDGRYWKGSETTDRCAKSPR